MNYTQLYQCIAYVISYYMERGNLMRICAINILPEKHLIVFSLILSPVLQLTFCFNESEPVFEVEKIWNYM